MGTRSPLLVLLLRKKMGMCLGREAPATPVTRMTSIPIKAGVIEEIVKLADKDDVQAALKEYPSLLSLRVFHHVAEDKTETIYAISCYPDAAAEEGARAKIQAVLAPMKEHLAGGPDSIFGPEYWSFTGDGSSDQIARISKIPMKPDWVAPFKEVANSEAFKTIVNDPAYKKANSSAKLFSCNDGAMGTAISFWPDTESMEASQDKFKEALGSVKDLLAGAPDTTVGTKVWEYKK